MIFNQILLANACLNSINGFLSSPLTGWFPIAFFGVMVMMGIFALLYTLGPLIGRAELRAWTKVKIYETLFGFFLIIIFASFATMLCTVNPISTYTQAGLIPKACVGASGVDNIFGLAECDLYNFNNNIVGLINNMVSLMTFMLSSAPGVSASSAGAIPGVGVKFSFGLDASAVKLFFESAASTFGGFILLSQVQLVLLDGAMIIFAILLPMGLLARIFGVTRSFGGAMIAFAMGIGFIFPLSISITYGFLGSMIDGFASGQALAAGVGGQANAFNFNLAQAIIAFQNAASGASGGSGIRAGTFLNLLGSLADPASLFLTFLEFIGVGVVGTLILPILTLTIVNTFIIDFSQAMGERMDLFSLLTRVI